MFYNSSKRISRRRTQPLMDNNNHNYNGLLRNKFWFIFITLFFFWYLLLYGFDWSTLPLLSSLSRNQEQSLDSNSNPGSSDILSDSNVKNHEDDREDDPIDVDPTKQVNNAVIAEDNTAAKDDDSDDGNNENAATDDGDDDDNVTMEDVQDLERELESILPQEKPERPNDVNTEKSARTRKNPNCKGRYVYMHDIPARYNSDYVKNCRSLNKWHDMCQYFANSGLGQELGNPQRLFSSSGWYVTNQFSLELIFHNRMKRYECLSNDSSKATAFFVPYYAGLDVSRYLWDPQSSASVRDSDLSGLFAWLRSRPEWAKTGGCDHFLVAGRITWDFRRADWAGWGNKLMLVPEAQNMTMLTIESSPWDKNDFAVPYPTYFHPSSDEQVVQWQNRMRRVRRRALFCFAGAPRPDIPGSIRGEIMEQCASSSARRRCRMLECKDAKSNCLKPANLMKMFQGSTFCLQPPGDSFTRRSTFDSILAGCIPVFFHPSSAYVQYLWHLPRDFGSYSVLIPEDDVKGKRVSIERALSRVPRAKVSEMRENVIRLIPRVVYTDPRSRLEGGGFDDAFDLTVRGVVERVERLKKSGGDDFDAYASWKYYAFGTTKAHEWDHYFRRGQNYSYNS